MVVTPQAIIGTVVELLTSSTRIDVVQILDQQTMTQVFSSARPLRAEIKEIAKVSKYPLETGSISADNRVSLPTEINILVLIPATAYASVYPQIRTAWQNATLLAVQTRTGVYKNMVLEGIPHVEEPEMFSSVSMELRLSEFIQVSSSAASSPLLDNYSPVAPQAQNTINTGLIQGLIATSSSLSYFHAASLVGL